MRLLLALLFLFADDPAWQVLNRAAREAIIAKDYVKLRQTLLALQPLMPGNPRIVYNLAASSAHIGDRDAALRGLRDLAAMGLVYDLAADDDFASLKDSTEFAAVVERMADNKKPVTHAQLSTALAERDLIPEDIAYDVKSKRFFISSVRQSKILSSDGRQFAISEWPVFALAIDAKHRILWATTGWVPQCAVCDKKDQDKTALLAFDVDTGQLKQRIDSPWKGLLGDMTLSSNGDVYVSEGFTVLSCIDSTGATPAAFCPFLSYSFHPEFARK